MSNDKNGLDANPMKIPAFISSERSKRIFKMGYEAGIEEGQRVASPRDNKREDGDLVVGPEGARPADKATPPPRAFYLERVLADLVRDRFGGKGAEPGPYAVVTHLPDLNEGVLTIVDADGRKVLALAALPGVESQEELAAHVMAVGDKVAKQLGVEPKWSVK